MKRVLAVCAIVSVILLACQAFGVSPTRADDGADATIAALQTKVAVQATSIAKRDAKIETQRTQIAGLHATVNAQAKIVPTPASASGVMTFSGSGGQATNIFSIPVSGVYRLAGRLTSGSFLQVQFYTASGDWEPSLFIVANDKTEQSAAGYIDAGSYYMKISAAGVWMLTLGLLQ